MQYDLQQDYNTGNWWIVTQDEDGYRKIVYTLSAELGRVQARKHMDKLVQEWGKVDRETYSNWRSNELSKLIEDDEKVDYSEWPISKRSISKLIEDNKND